MQQQEDRLGFVSIPLSFRTAGSRAASSLTRCTLRTESQYLDLSVPGLKAFISKPTAQGDEARDRGVILMSDIIGHTDARTQRVAESVAAAGFTTVVPDLYGGNSWKDEWDKSGYEAWRLSLDPAWVDNAVRAAAQELRRAYGVAKIGLLGFCFGGGRALEETTKAREDVAPKAAVAFYPTRFAGREIGRDAKCPVMVVTGDCDELVPPEVVGHLRAGLAENSSVSDWAIRVYEGAGHAFAHKPQSDQDQVDAEASLQSAIQWLDRYV